MESGINQPSRCERAIVQKHSVLQFRRNLRAEASYAARGTFHAPLLSHFPLPLPFPPSLVTHAVPSFPCTLPHTPLQPENNSTTDPFFPAVRAESQAVNPARATLAHNMKTLALAAILAGLPSFVAAASVDAGALTTVTAEAPLYDPSLSADNGCDPSGCVAGLTRVSGHAVHCSVRRFRCGTPLSYIHM